MTKKNLPKLLGKKRAIFLPNISTNLLKKTTTLPIIRKISKIKYVLLSIGKVLKKLAIFSKVVGPLTKNFFVASFMNPQQTFIGIMLDHVQNPALIQGLSIPGLQIRIS